MTQTIKTDLALDARATLGEGPVWLGDDARLLWVNISDHEVHWFDPVSGHDDIVDVGQPVGAAVPRAGGGLVLALREGFATLDGSGPPQLVVPVEADRPDTRMNDGKCDPAGRFFAGTMGSGPSPAGSLYRLDHDLRVTTVFTGVSISNGLDWTADRRRMYYIDTPTHGVDVCDYQVDSGEVANRRRLIDIPADAGSPDGMTLDEHDYLWVALWGGWGLRRYSPDGQLDRVVEVPASQVTSCAFGGPDLADLYITTARGPLSEEQVREQPHAGGVFHCRPGVRGRPATAFAG